MVVAARRDAAAAHFAADAHRVPVVEIGHPVVAGRDDHLASADPDGHRQLADAAAGHRVRPDEPSRDAVPIG